MFDICPPMNTISRWIALKTKCKDYDTYQEKESQYDSDEYDEI